MPAKLQADLTELAPAPCEPVTVQEGLAKMHQHYNLTCMLCGTNVGQLVGGRFVPHASGVLASRTGGRPRCSRCGGSLYVEPMEACSSLDPLIRAAQIEGATRKQARLRQRSAAASADGADAADEIAATGAA